MFDKQFERKLELENSKHSNTEIASLIRTHWCNLGRVVAYREISCKELLNIDDALECLIKLKKY